MGRQSALSRLPGLRLTQGGLGYQFVKCLSHGLRVGRRDDQAAITQHPARVTNVRADTRHTSRHGLGQYVGKSFRTRREHEHIEGRVAGLHLFLLAHEDQTRGALPSQDIRESSFLLRAQTATNHDYPDLRVPRQHQGQGLQESWHVLVRVVAPHPADRSDLSLL